MTRRRLCHVCLIIVVAGLTWQPCFTVGCSIRVQNVDATEDDREDQKQELADRKRKREEELDQWTDLFVTAAQKPSKNQRKKFQQLVGKLFSEHDAQLRKLSDLL